MMGGRASTPDEEEAGLLLVVLLGMFVGALESDREEAWLSCMA